MLDEQAIHMSDDRLTLAQPSSAGPTSIPDASSEYSQQAMDDLLRDASVASASPADSSADQPPSSSGIPWRLPAWQARFFLLALATAALVLFLRLFQLDQLQAEIYGDIATVYEYAADIRACNWPTQFFLAIGPLYPYAITPILMLTGLTYFGLKLAAVVVSLGVLAATYALSRRLIDDHFALLAVFIAGVSSWLLIFSRLGDIQIIVPLLTTCTLWLVVRIAQGSHRAEVLVCAAVSSLGLYAHAQSFVLPAAIWLALLCLRWTGQRITWGDLGRFALIVVLCTLPFVWIVSRDPTHFLSGYIGEKLESGGNPIGALLGNAARALVALHVRGDINFRGNPAALPHLDWVSGALFLAGVVFWLRPERRRLSPALLVPLILLQLPSMLVLSQTDEVPSASRTLGIAPIAYILVASGLWWLVQAIHLHQRRRLIGTVVAGALLAAIVLLNAQRYFQLYIGGLPYKNTPIGRVVTTYLDSLPPETQVYLVGCCWEERMPEPKGIQYTMVRPQNLHTIELEQLDCQQLRSFAQPAVLVWSFHMALPGRQLEPCQQWLPAQLYSSARGLPVFYAAPLRLDRAATAAPEQPVPITTQPGEQLESTQVQLDGEPIEVRHSSLDIGQAADLFDGKRDSLIRGKDANPLVLELHFTRPRAVQLVNLDLGSIPQFQVTISLTGADGAATSFTENYENLPADPHLDLPIPGGSRQVRVLRVEIHDLLPSAGAPHIHVRELTIR
jgi:4-amino-4-deoxy-L-arabinose transferase-like glycosyltransferase